MSNRAEALDKLIQLSMYYHAKYCANLLAQGRTERQVKAALSKKVKGKVSDQGIGMVFKMGCDIHLANKNKELPTLIATNDLGTKPTTIIHPEYGNN